MATRNWFVELQKSLTNNWRKLEINKKQQHRQN